MTTIGIRPEPGMTPERALLLAGFDPLEARSADIAKREQYLRAADMRQTALELDALAKTLGSMPIEQTPYFQRAQQEAPEGVKPEAYAKILRTKDVNRIISQRDYANAAADNGIDDTISGKFSRAWNAFAHGMMVAFPQWNLSPYVNPPELFGSPASPAAQAFSSLYPDVEAMQKTDVLRHYEKKFAAPEASTALQLTQSAPTMASGVIQPLLGAKIGGTIGTAVMPGPGTAVGSLIGAALGMIGSAAQMYVSKETESYLELVDAGVPVDEAKAAARVSALWEAGIEFGLQAMISTAAKPLGKAIGIASGLPKTEPGLYAKILGLSTMPAAKVSELVDAAPTFGKFSKASLLKDLFENEARKMSFLTSAKLAVYGGSMGALEEAFQQLGDIALAKWADDKHLTRMLPRNEDGTINTTEVHKSILYAAWLGFLGEGGMGTASVGLSMLNRMPEMRAQAHLEDLRARMKTDFGQASFDLKELFPDEPDASGAVKLGDLDSRVQEYVLRRAAAKMLKAEQQAAANGKEAPDSAYKSQAFREAMRETLEDPLFAAALTMDEFSVPMFSEDMIVLEWQNPRTKKKIRLNVVRSDAPMPGNIAGASVIDQEGNSIVGLSPERFDELVEAGARNLVVLDTYAPGLFGHEVFHAIINQPEMAEQRQQMIQEILSSPDLQESLEKLRQTYGLDKNDPAGMERAAEELAADLFAQYLSGQKQTVQGKPATQSVFEQTQSGFKVVNPSEKVGYVPRAVDSAVSKLLRQIAEGAVSVSDKALSAFKTARQGSRAWYNAMQTLFQEAAASERLQEAERAFYEKYAQAAQVASQVFREASRAWEVVSTLWRRLWRDVKASYAAQQREKPVRPEDIVAEQTPTDAAAQSKRLAFKAADNADTPDGGVAAKTKLISDELSRSLKRVKVERNRVRQPTPAKPAPALSQFAAETEKTAEAIPILRIDKPIPGKMADDRADTTLLKQIYAGKRTAFLSRTQEGRPGRLLRFEPNGPVYRLVRAEPLSPSDVQVYRSAFPKMFGLNADYVQSVKDEDLVGLYLHVIEPYAGAKTYAEAVEAAQQEQADAVAALYDELKNSPKKALRELGRKIAETRREISAFIEQTDPALRNAHRRNADVVLRYLMYPSALRAKIFNNPKTEAHKAYMALPALQEAFDNLALYLDTAAMFPKAWKTLKNLPNDPRKAPEAFAPLASHIGSRLEAMFELGLLKAKKGADVQKVIGQLVEEIQQQEPARQAALAELAAAAKDRDQKIQEGMRRLRQLAKDVWGSAASDQDVPSPFWLFDQAVEALLEIRAKQMVDAESAQRMAEEGRKMEWEGLPAKLPLAESRAIDETLERLSVGQVKAVLAQLGARKNTLDAFDYFDADALERATMWMTAVEAMSASRGKNYSRPMVAFVQAARDLAAAMDNAKRRMDRALAEVRRTQPRGAALADLFNAITATPTELGVSASWDGLVKLLDLANDQTRFIVDAYNRLLASTQPGWGEYTLRLGDKNEPIEEKVFGVYGAPRHLPNVSFPETSKGAAFDPETVLADMLISAFDIPYDLPKSGWKKRRADTLAEEDLTAQTLDAEQKKRIADSGALDYEETFGLHIEPATEQTARGLARRILLDAAKMVALDIASPITPGGKYQETTFKGLPYSAKSPGALAKRLLFYAPRPTTASLAEHQALQGLRLSVQQALHAAWEIHTANLTPRNGQIHAPIESAETLTPQQIQDMLADEMLQEDAVSEFFAEAVEWYSQAVEDPFAELNDFIDDGVAIFSQTKDWQTRYPRFKQNARLFMKNPENVDAFLDRLKSGDPNALRALLNLKVNTLFECALRYAQEVDAKRVSAMRQRLNSMQQFIQDHETALREHIQSVMRLKIADADAPKVPRKKRADGNEARDRLFGYRDVHLLHHALNVVDLHKSFYSLFGVELPERLRQVVSVLTDTLKQAVGDKTAAQAISAHDAVFVNAVAARFLLEAEADIDLYNRRYMELARQIQLEKDPTRLETLQTELAFLEQNRPTSEEQMLDLYARAIETAAEKVSARLKESASKAQTTQAQFELDQLKLYQSAVQKAKQYWNDTAGEGAKVKEWLNKHYKPATEALWTNLEADTVFGRPVQKINAWTPRHFVDQMKEDHDDVMSASFSAFTHHALARTATLAEDIAAGKILSSPDALSAFDLGGARLIHAAHNARYLQNELASGFLTETPNGDRKRLEGVTAKKFIVTYQYAPENTKTVMTYSYAQAQEMIQQAQMAQGATARLETVAVPVYAPSEFADYFNRIAAPSLVRQEKLTRAILATTVKLKMYRLAWSLFHRRALLWSVYFGSVMEKHGTDQLSSLGRLKKHLDWNTHRQLAKALMDERHPDLFALVFYGLTPLKMQEFGEANLQYMTLLDKWLNSAAPNWLQNFVKPAAKATRISQNELFGMFGNMLKIAAAHREATHWRDKHAEKIMQEKLESKKNGRLSPHAEAYLRQFKDDKNKIKSVGELHGGLWIYDSPTENEILRAAAGIANADFGGLHTARLGWSKTWFDVARLAMLGPDWTLSNLGVAVKGVAALMPEKWVVSDQLSGPNAYAAMSAVERQMYRALWLRVLGRALLIKAAAEILLAGVDDLTFWQRMRLAALAGPHAMLAVDITPIVSLVGAKTEGRALFHILGHWADPVKWLAKPVESAVYKSSTLLKPALTAVSGVNYQKKRFTPAGQIPYKGLTTLSAKHGPVKLNEIPAFLIDQSLDVITPFAAQAAMRTLEGGQETFLGISHLLGLPVTANFAAAQTAKKSKTTKKSTSKR